MYSLMILETGVEQFGHLHRVVPLEAFQHSKQSYEYTINQYQLIN